MNPETPTARYRFGIFQLDLESGELYKHGLKVRLQEQPFRVLVMLLEKPGDVITRDELQQRLWGHNTYVGFDHSLNISINKLREALGDSASNPRFIETLPRRGYRFLAPVTAVEPEPAPTLAAPAPVSPGPPVTESPSAIPEPKAPSRRWFWAALVGTALFVVLVAVWIWSRVGSRPAAFSAKRVMLAVLPFQDLSGDRSDDYFIYGLHDEMIAELGHLQPARLGVIARTSTAAYGTNPKPISQIGHDLDVQYVLEGTVRHMGDHFRITAELIKVSDQTQLWTETYEQNMGDLLALQEDVAQRVSSALQMEFLPGAREEMRQAATVNPAAFDAYLRGRYLWYSETRPSLEQAIGEFQKAIALDPKFAPAYVGLADAYGVLGGYGFVPADEAFAKSKAAAAKALQLNPDFSDAYASMAYDAFYYDWNWPQAEAYFKRALALNPNNEVAHEFYSSFLHVMGRLDEAEAENRIATELDPLSGWVRDDKGWMLLSRHRPQEALAEFQRGTQLNPRFPAGHLSVAVAYSRLGQYPQALAEVQKAEELGSDPTRALEIRGSVQALSGDAAGAQATVDKLVTGQINGRVSPYSVALIYTAMGNKKEALDWLEKAYKGKDTWVIWIGVLVEWGSLRSEPRFVNLIHELNEPI